MSKLNKIKGFADLFIPDSTLFTYLEDTARHVFSTYGYREIRVPVVEFTELFSRSIGTETDVVQKEMFTFPDRKGRSLTLRPEATAGIMRAYIEANCNAQETITKLFSFGPMFRYERPQKGRMRQFHQLDCECLGEESPYLDAEVILMLMTFLSAIGLDDLTLELNTLGCRDCRPGYKEELLKFLHALNADNLCEDCRKRLHTNPLRVLDCKVPTCKEMTANAPAIKDHVCSVCANHFAVVLSVVTVQHIPHVINPRLVRGLDYYNRTTFEVVSNTIGSQGSVAGGGRYDGLIAQLGGSDVPGIGFACGMERLALMLQEKADALVRRPDFFIALLHADAPIKALEIAQHLRNEGMQGETAFAARSLKSQMRQASRLKSRFCLLLGDTEISSNTVLIKDMDTGEQVSIPVAELASWAQKNSR